MLAHWRSRRNRPYLHAVLAVGLVAWLSLLISATCTMPVMANAMPEHLSACPEQLSHPNAPSSQMSQACAFKACLESQPDPVFPVSAPNGEIPLLALIFMFLVDAWFGAGLRVLIPRGFDPPSGRRIPLIYRFCTLLN